MNQAHLHLLLNHVPILGSLFGLLLLLGGLLFRSRPVQRAAHIALVAAALGAIPVLLTGEGAEEQVERIAGVSDYYMEEHEETAETAFWMLIAAGALALAALAWSFLSKGKHTALSLVVVLAAAIAFGLMARTGWLGGKIRHSEIRTSAAPAAEHDDR
jgi:uncharacterized membrane protein